MADEVNKIGLRNTRATFTEEPACRDGYANGTRPPEGGHSGGADPKYEHWCRPEPRREFPWESSDLERAKERQGGMQEDTQGLKRAESGGVIGSQIGARPEGPHFTKPWGEYAEVNQWDKEQEHTYGRGEDKEPFDD